MPRSYFWLRRERCGKRWRESMKERLIEIILKEFRQAFREPRMRTMLFLPPIIQLLVFGYAVNLDVEHANMAWMDQDHTPESRRSEEHTSELQSLRHLVCRLLLEK